jgi:hypothetical protein
LYGQHQNFEWISGSQSALALRLLVDASIVVEIRHKKQAQKPSKKPEQIYFRSPPEHLRNFYGSGLFPIISSAKPSIAKS